MTEIACAPARLENFCAARNTKCVSCPSACCETHSASRAEILTRWNATSMSTRCRVRLQPIYSDRSLEAIQMRYRENAGVINRRRTACLTCSLFITICFPNASRGFPGIFDYCDSPFYPLIMQFVAPRAQDSLIHELMEIDLRFLDLETRTRRISSSLRSSVSAAVCSLLPYSSIMLFVTYLVCKI